MKLIYYGTGDPGWLEPENDEDDKFLDETRDLPFMRVIVLATEKGLLWEHAH